MTKNSSHLKGELWEWKWGSESLPTLFCSDRGWPAFAIAIIFFGSHLELILLIRVVIYGTGPLCNLQTLLPSPLIARQVAPTISMILLLGKLRPLEVQWVADFIIHENCIPDVHSTPFHHNSKAAVWGRRQGQAWVLAWVLELGKSSVEWCIHTPEVWRKGSWVNPDKLI